MRILVIVNLFPPLHAGTFDFRCEAVCGLLQKRGHEIHILTSKYGLTNEQRDPDVERRLILNGAFDQPMVTAFGDLKEIEEHNNAVVREVITDHQPDLIYVWSLQGLSKSIIFTLRNTKVPTVYEISDDWLINGLRADPWLAWWNRDKAPVLSGLWRKVLEISGKRDGINTAAPTRMMKGYERVPELYADGTSSVTVQPGSIGAFHFDRLYFCSQALKAEAESAGFRVVHAEVIYPGIATDKFLDWSQNPQFVPKNFSS